MEININLDALIFAFREQLDGRQEFTTDWAQGYEAGRKAGVEACARDVAFLVCLLPGVSVEQLNELNDLSPSCPAPQQPA